MLIAPLWKHLTFGFMFGSRDLQDFRHPKSPQMANLRCALILIRESPPDELDRKSVV